MYYVIFLCVLVLVNMRFPFVYSEYPEKAIDYLWQKLNAVAIAKKQNNLWYMLLLGFIALFSVLLLIKIPILGYVFYAYLAYSLIELSAIFVKGKEIFNLIKRAEYEEAVAGLQDEIDLADFRKDESGLRDALVYFMEKKLVENFSAPFFYMSVFGLPLAWKYKVASFANQVFPESAPVQKIFFFLNWIPSRIMYVAIYLSARILGLKCENFWSTVEKQSKEMQNAALGFVQIAIALLLHENLGDQAFVRGNDEWKSVYYEQGWSNEKLSKLFTLLNYSVWIFVAFCVLLYIIF